MAIETSIPVVDFAKWQPDSTKAEKKAVADALVEACRNVGFVYIINHPVGSEKVSAAFDMMKRLYDLPKEKKMLAPHPPGFAVHRGYSWPGLEKIGNYMGDEEDKESLVEELRAVSDVKETYEIGSEANPQGNIWLPEEVLPGFRQFMTEFYWECHRASEQIMSAMAIGIGLEDENYFRPSHSGNNNQLRLAHYPPVPASLLEEGKGIRCDAHSDWPSITLLFQDDCGGLQIEDPKEKGKFIDVSPLPDYPDAIVMNIADLMMRWTNDNLKSTIHRVNLPPRQDRFTGDERLTRRRFSIPYFVSPEGQYVVKCLEPYVDEQHPAKYEPIVWDDYCQMRGNMLYQAQEA